MKSKRWYRVSPMAALLYLMTCGSIFTAASSDAATSLQIRAALEPECLPSSPMATPPPPSAAPWAQLRSDGIPASDCPELTTCLARCSFPTGWQDRQESTYINIRCFHNRSQTLTAVSHVLRDHPDRAITLLLAEDNHRMESLHQDVLQPLQRNLVDLEVNYVASAATERLYNAGTLPSLVSVRFAMGLDLRIGRRDFSRLPQIRQIIFDQLTIAAIEPYTFTDLPLLGALQLETGLDYMLREELPKKLFGASKYGQPPKREKILHHLYERHCDCAYTWLRNMFRRGPELLSRRRDGELVIIGNYFPRDHRHFGDDGVLLVDCAAGNASTFFESGTGRALEFIPAHLFSLNTTCHNFAC
ncbi:uncharacterized protein LOC129590949 [Paramacrobiotus metropolitanus]|uniref:uncharacterized protein LOC129590949 n=1 Tax=Paramacrobiotus metropolitanus TaxID=2943436 RepID=UPI0024459BB1|nr:uncharacterized protein LOC129590949 [Paramacrobiotus metropolitanus]